MPSDKVATARWLRDIEYHIDLAESFIAGSSLEALKNDVLRLYAVIRCLEVISEASRRLPDDTKKRHPSIPWKEMAAAGNIYRHEYEAVAAPRVWRTVKDSLPPLRAVVLIELNRLG
jgi:uncharacterized protein with HEPN domain